MLKFYSDLRNIVASAERGQDQVCLTLGYLTDRNRISIILFDILTADALNILQDVSGPFRIWVTGADMLSRLGG